MGEGRPPVSVIVPTWNGQDYVVACLDSLLTQDYPEFEVIVVDNASSDGTPELVAERFPAVRLLRNERNLGFAGGANVGLCAARGEALLLFNQDAVAEAGWLAAMVDGLLSHPDAGIAGCKILFPDGKTLWHAGVDLVKERFLPMHRGDGETDQGQYDRLTDPGGTQTCVEAVTGAAMAIRHDVLDKIGLLDEDYFLYFEDIDLCLRARAAGYRIVYLPDAVVRHHLSASLGAASKDKMLTYHTSRLLFLLKHRDVDWFRNQFLCAEIKWLNAGRLVDEYHMLRESYQRTMTGLFRCGGPYRFARNRFDTEQRAQLADALSCLIEAAVAATQMESGPELQALAGEIGDWWQLRERPFASQVPLLGPLIARFRAAWNNVATRWYVLPLLWQQMEVNRRLAVAVERDRHRIGELSHAVASLSREVARLSARMESGEDER
jgi:GT2 family glycosyltransferase